MALEALPKLPPLPLIRFCRCRARSCILRVMLTHVTSIQKGESGDVLRTTVSRLKKSHKFCGRHVWMDVAFPSRAGVRILADEPVSHLVRLPLDARHALRRQLVAAELLENVVARGAAVDPGRNKSSLKLKSRNIIKSGTSLEIQLTPSSKRCSPCHRKGRTSASSDPRLQHILGH